MLIYLQPSVCWQVVKGWAYLTPLAFPNFQAAGLRLQGLRWLPRMLWTLAISSLYAFVFFQVVGSDVMWRCGDVEWWGSVMWCVVCHASCGGVVVWNGVIVRCGVRSVKDECGGGMWWRGGLRFVVARCVICGGVCVVCAVCGVQHVFVWCVVCGMCSSGVVWLCGV